jgi:hypothetical protein
MLCAATKRKLKILAWDGSDFIETKVKDLSLIFLTIQGITSSRHRKKCCVVR